MGDGIHVASLQDDPSRPHLSAPKAAASAWPPRGRRCARKRRVAATPLSRLPQPPRQWPLASRQKSADRKADPGIPQKRKLRTKRNRKRTRDCFSGSRKGVLRAQPPPRPENTRKRRGRFRTTP